MCACERADVLTEDDHARGCAGREYVCTCGYDERVAAEIARLRLRVAELESADRDVGPTPDNGPHCRA